MPSFGSGASKIILCFPLIFPNHASSAGSAELPPAALSAARRDGSAALTPTAAAAAARRPRNPRRGVGDAMRSDMVRPPGEVPDEWMDAAKVARFLNRERARGGSIV